MDKSKWPTLTLPREQDGEKDGLGELTQEESMVDQNISHGSASFDKNHSTYLGEVMKEFRTTQDSVPDGEEFPMAADLS
jgi:hypothetical protein